MKLAQKKTYKRYGEALISGTKGIFTMHGRTMEDIKKNPEVNGLIETKQIEKVLFL